jgi:hypothetical protein
VYCDKHEKIVCPYKLDWQRRKNLDLSKLFEVRFFVKFQDADFEATANQSSEHAQQRTTSLRPCANTY